MKTLLLLLDEKKKLLGSLSLALLIFLLPAVVHQQAITGPLINALLILSFFYLSKSQAFFLALIPSTMALARGLLPVALAPIVPFIMISNCLYIEVFAMAEEKFKVFTESKAWMTGLTVLLAAILKAGFLFLVVKVVMLGFFAPALASKLQAMMSWAQLWTAFVGGLLASIFISYGK